MSHPIQKLLLAFLLATAPAAQERARPTQLAKGSRCIDCHHRPGPEMALAAQWPEVLRVMSQRAKLSADERERILRYVLAAKMMPE